MPLNFPLISPYSPTHICPIHPTVVQGAHRGLPACVRHPGPGRGQLPGAGRAKVRLVYLYMHVRCVNICGVFSVMQMWCVFAMICGQCRVICVNKLYLYIFLIPAYSRIYHLNKLVCVTLPYLL